MRERWAESGAVCGPMASGCRAPGGLTSRLPSLRQPLPSDAFFGWGPRTGGTREARPAGWMRGGAGGAADPPGRGSPRCRAGSGEPRGTPAAERVRGISRCRAGSGKPGGTPTSERIRESPRCRAGSGGSGEPPLQSGFGGAPGAPARGARRERRHQQAAPREEPAPAAPAAFSFPAALPAPLARPASLHTPEKSLPSPGRPRPQPLPAPGSRSAGRLRRGAPGWKRAGRAAATGGQAHGAFWKMLLCSSHKRPGIKTTEIPVSKQWEKGRHQYFPLL